jgi:hypothetical protein
MRELLEPRVQDHPEQHSKTVSQKKQTSQARTTSAPVSVILATQEAEIRRIVV